jgi:cell division protein FtsQ
VWPRRNRNRRKPAEPPARLPSLDWRRIVRSAAALAAAIAVIALLAAALNRPIATVSVSGRFERVSPLDVARVVETSVQGAGLLGVDIGRVRAAVERLAWVDTASVTRSWPRGLAVRIVEEVPAARWAGGGLINVRGERFRSNARDIPSGLPLLCGPEGSARTVAERYFAMQARLTEVGLRIAALNLDARGSWQFDLEDGVAVRLGRKRIDARFETFMTVAAKIVAARASDIAYVDMRYMNGFAIGWRAGGAPRKAKGEES